ncbi:MAG: hypothetical protein QM537_00965 [Candidatus Symbiobacter sp.]|nr:hypothetical protein [Candidatus Symbiobacter sp.]
MSKNRTLPVTDLAMLYPLPADKRERYIINFINSNHYNISYNPFRQAIPSIVGASTSLFEFTRLELEILTNEFLKKRFKNEEDRLANLNLLKSLYNHWNEHDYKAVERVCNPIPIGLNQFVKPWNDFYSIEDGRIFFYFIDPRRSSGLTNQGSRNFIFSIMYHNLAVGDFSDADFKICRFSDDSFRKKVTSHHIERGGIFSLKELNYEIDLILNLYKNLLENGAAGYRRPGKTGTDDLFS